MNDRGDATGRLSFETELSRRDVLKAAVGGGFLAGGGKALDNAALGYGVLTGTNLLEQDLGPLVSDALTPSPFELSLDDTRIEFTGNELLVNAIGQEKRLGVEESTPEDAAGVNADLDLPGSPLEELVTDLGNIANGKYSFGFSSLRAFFDRIDTERTRPFTVELLRDRRWTDVPAGTVREFSGESTTDPEATVLGLMDAFRKHTYYDVPRYLAGSVEDNLIPGDVDLRAPFRSPTGFDAIQDGRDTGLFCWDFTHRSIEALQAVPAHRQDPPVFGWEVYDRRHGHMYTAIGSALHEDDELVLPITFVDYSRSTWFDDFGLRWLFGEGLNAYDSRHRATWIGGEPQLVDG